MQDAPAIVDYSPDDEAEVVALWHRCGLVVPWNNPARDIALVHETGHGQLLVARDADGIAGAVMVGHDGHRGWIYYLAVAPDRRRQGLGRRLVEASEAWVAARGVPKLQLMVRRSNAAVHDFYAASGYEDSEVVVLQRWLAPKADEA